MINVAAADAVVLGHMLGPLLAPNAPQPKAFVARLQWPMANPVADGCK